MSRLILRAALLGGLLALGAAAAELPHESFEEDFQFGVIRSGSVPDGISALGSLVLLECTIYHE